MKFCGATIATGLLVAASLASGAGQEAESHSAAPSNSSVQSELDLGLPPLPVAEGESDLDLALPPLEGLEPQESASAVFDSVLPETASSSEWDRGFSGYVGAEAFVFGTDGIAPSQDYDTNTSAVLEPEFEFRNEQRRITLRFVPFGRLDQRDDERTHVDIRELSFLKEFEASDILVGFSQVYWGSTESVHVVDVINQTDLVEDLDQEAKLGQPMINPNFYTDLGRFSFFVMPYFRERTFPGQNGRLRTQPRIEGDRAIYESSAEEWHPDLALRWSRTIGDLDLGLSYFWGTTREPVYVIDRRDPADVVLRPFYEIVHQPALDFTYASGKWLLKGEAIYREGQRDGDFIRSAAGFEYTVSGLFGSRTDLGLIGEYLYDCAGNNDINPFENDIAYGLRFSLNDLRNTSILVSAITDSNDGSTFVNLEAKMRLGNHWVARAEARTCASIPRGDFPLNGFRRDRYILFGLEYHF